MSGMGMDTAAPEPSDGNHTGDSHAIEMVSEERVYHRYLSMYHRKVRFTSRCGTQQPEEHHYDVVGHPRCEFKFSVIFPFHPGKDGAEHEVTLIREYCQGPNKMAYGLPAGGFNPKGDGSMEDCARAELSEEVHLTGGELLPLLPEGHPGIAETKWCANVMVPFLVIDPEHDPCPASRDAEEHTLQVLRMKLSDFKKLLYSGDMMLPSITTAHMALEKLQERGLL